MRFSTCSLFNYLLIWNMGNSQFDIWFHYKYKTIFILKYIQFNKNNNNNKYFLLIIIKSTIDLYMIVEKST